MIFLGNLNYNNMLPNDGFLNMFRELILTIFGTLQNFFLPPKLIPHLVLPCLHQLSTPLQLQFFRSLQLHLIFLRNILEFLSFSKHAYFTPTPWIFFLGTPFLPLLMLPYLSFSPLPYCKNHVLCRLTLQAGNSIKIRMLSLFSLNPPMDALSLPTEILTRFSAFIYLYSRPPRPPLTTLF